MQETVREFIRLDQRIQREVHTRAMFMREAVDAARVAKSSAMNIALFVTAAGTIIIGIFPEFFIRAASWGLISPNVTTNPLAAILK